MTALFRPEWRMRKSGAFDLKGNSTAGGVKTVNLWGKETEIYGNANFSIYSARKCNARCRFCIEEVRPASRGGALEHQKTFEFDDNKYFAALHSSLTALKPLKPTLSFTGGEPSLDPRLPEIMKIIAQFEAKRRTMTTNGSGLFDVVEGKRVIDWLKTGKLTHLNISRAHFDDSENDRLMRFKKAPGWGELQEINDISSKNNMRVRLSCALIKSGVYTLNGILKYLDHAKNAGVDNVIFRQLMLIDEEKMARGEEVIFSNQERAPLEPLLNEISLHNEFKFVRQIMGYYYYVEVWNYKGMDVVFEEADLATLEKTKAQMPGVVHELIFHPNAKLCSTWQPWDGILGPSE